MKTLKFSTLAQKTYEIKFNDVLFFDYMHRCGVVNVPIKNQIGLYLNNLHEKLIQAGVPFDSVLPNTIQYDFSTDFRKRYDKINDMLKYGL
jgi:hypothetical protein